MTVFPFRSETGRPRWRGGQFCALASLFRFGLGPVGAVWASGFGGLFRLLPAFLLASATFAVGSYPTERFGCQPGFAFDCICLGISFRRSRQPSRRRHLGAPFIIGFRLSDSAGALFLYHFHLGVVDGFGGSFLPQALM